MQQEAQESRAKSMAINFSQTSAVAAYFRCQGLHPVTLRLCHAPQSDRYSNGGSGSDFYPCEVPKETFIGSGPKRSAPVLSAPGGKYTDNITQPIF